MSCLRKHTIAKIIARIGVLLWVVILGAWGFDQFVLQGLIAPVYVVSGSMAPALGGASYEIACDDCGWGYVFGVESRPPDDRTVCPNCGWQQLPLAAPRAGQRVLLDRFTFRWRAPRRWEIVAAALGAPAGRQRTVKRIVGLPGELIEIESGDVIAQGKRIRKSLASMTDLAILVHDDHYRPRSEGSAAPRWRPESSASRWDATGDGYVWDADHDGDESDDWLVYHHVACWPAAYQRRVPSRINDNCGYNQGLSRSLNAVQDFYVTCRITADGPGELRLRRKDLAAELWWSLKSGTVRLMVADQHHEFHVAEASGTIECTMLFGSWDRQVVFAIDRQEIFRADYTPAELISEMTTQPLAVGFRGGRRLVLTTVQVWRDVHYTNPLQRDGPWPATRRLGPNEYLLLGDNSPLSRDARHGPQHGFVHRRQLRGRVFGH